MRSGSSAAGNNSFNNLVGAGSNKHVVGLDAIISVFASPVHFKIEFKIFVFFVFKVLNGLEPSYLSDLTQSR